MQFNHGTVDETEPFQQFSVSITASAPPPVDTWSQFLSAYSILCPKGAVSGAVGQSVGARAEGAEWGWPCILHYAGIRLGNSASLSDGWSSGRDFARLPGILKRVAADAGIGKWMAWSCWTWKCWSLLWLSYALPLHGSYPTLANVVTWKHWHFDSWKSFVPEATLFFQHVFTFITYIRELSLKFF